METTASNSSAAMRTTDRETPGSTQSALKPQAERLAAKAHDTIDKVSETAVRTEQQLRDNVAQAEAQLRAFSAKAQGDAEVQVQQLKSYVQKKPLQSAGLAFAAGLVISRLLR